VPAASAGVAGKMAAKRPAARAKRDRGFTGLNKNALLA